MHSALWACFSRCGARGFRRISFAGLLLVCTLAASGAYGQAATHLVISQVYGGGGLSGAAYNADYVEIFNPTASAISLNGYSIQYSSATSTTVSGTLALPNASVQPGHYFLVQTTIPGAVGVSLPTPDATNSSPNLSSTAGKVFLVNTTTQLTSACPVTSTAVIDYVGYGSTANCAYTAPAPAPGSSANADVRTNACIATGDSSTEFTASAANPHNSSSIGGGCLNGVTASANPSSLNTGSSTLLTVQVSGSGDLALTVTADLSALASGASATQKFYDDGATGGDVTANDRIFSFTLTVTNAGTFSIPVKVTDTQGRTATATITLKAVTPPTSTTIRAIQSAKPSTFAGQTVTTSGIIVGVESKGFYLESKDADTAPSTPEGIFVFTGSIPLSYIVPGAEVQVSGTVSAVPATTVSVTPATEIISPTAFSLLSSSNPLPAAVKITAAMDSPSGGIYQFTKYEGMRVAIDTLTATSGTSASLVESTETPTSTGLFYGVVSGVARPFREPGISITDLAYGTVPQSIPRFDSNPELLQIDTLSFSKNGVPAALDVTAGATLTSVVGVMDFTLGFPTIIVDAATRPTVTGLATAQPVPVETAQEFTVGSFEMDRFYTSDSTAPKNTGSSVTVLTTEAYQRRLKKASLAIRNVLNSPDILALQEVQDLAVMQDIANQVSADALAASQTDPAYTAYLFLGTDASGYNNGFLIRGGRVTVSKVEQLGLNSTFVDAGGNQAILNDRPPIVLHAGIKRGTATDYPVTVINVHQRSLNGIDDPTDTGKTIRMKREAQAEYLASLIQSYQAGGEHVVTVGNFNAYQFSDGFVDSLGVIEGSPVAANQVVQAPVSGLVNPTLLDASTALAATLQQSYVSSGSAAMLDHVVVTRDIVPTRIAYARVNSDYPGIYINDATRPEGNGDHDPFVAYFAIPSATGGGGSPTTPVITWTPSSTTGFKGVAIGTGVLDATSVTPGTFTYSATPTGGSATTINASSILAVGGYTLTANFTPTDTTNYTSASATSAFTVINGQIFVANSGGSVTSLYRDGSVQSAPASGGGIGAAVDANGFVWSISANGNGVAKFTDSGAAAATYTDATISGASALAVDGNGRVWIANSNAITALSNNGSPVFGNAVVTSSGLSSPASLQVDTAGSIWISSPGNDTVVEVIGVAAPVVTPTVAAVVSGTPGTKP